MNGVSATTNQTAKTYTGSVSSGAKFVATDSSNHEILSLSFPKAASYFYFNHATSFTITIDGSEITLSDAGGQNQGSPGSQTPSSDQGPGGQTPSSDQGPGGQSPPSDQGPGSQTPSSDQGPGNQTLSSDQGPGGQSPPSDQVPGSQTLSSDQGPGGQSPPSDQGPGSQTPSSDQGPGGQSPSSDQGPGGSASPGQEDKDTTSSEKHLIMIILHILPHQLIQIYQAKQYQVQLVEKVKYI